MQKQMLLLAIGLMVLMIGCNPTKKDEVNKQKEIEAIKLVLEKYALANENQDINMIEEIWCPSDSIVGIGTDNNEILLGFAHIRQAIQGQFETFTDTYISPYNQIVNLGEDGKTAWFSEILNYNYILDGKAQQYEGLRYTGVLVKKNGKWKLVQTHMSVPVVSVAE